MIRQLPSQAEVRQAMDQVIAAAREQGRSPTIAAVERALDVRHATFYRNFRDLITDHFQPQAASYPKPQPTRTDQAREASAVERLRQENTALRRLIAIYEEAIRQLTLTNQELRENIHDAKKITTLLPGRPSDEHT